MNVQHGRTRRWPKRLGITLGSLLIAIYGGGGWYFSGLLHDDGLAPKLPRRNHGVVVLEIGDTMITLDGSDRRAIEHDGTLGLWWPGGYGHVGPILGIDGDRVAREFEMIAGKPPPVCTGPVAECEEIDLEGYAYPSDPGDVDLEFEQTEYPTPLGPTPAWIVLPTGPPTGTFAIHFHGWRADRRETVRMLPIYADQGTTSMVAEYRNGPGAPADPSGLIRFGRTEWEDVEAAVRFALARGATGVVLVGYSTGAAAEMAFLENSVLRSHVDGLVFDAPNLDFGRAVSVEASRRSLPGTPMPVPRSLTAVAKAIADLRFDVGWSEIDYVDHESVIEVPTLVFHGSNDQTVPVSVSQDLAARYPTLVTLVVTDGADHVQSWNIDPHAYAQRVADFLIAVGQPGRTG